MGMFNTIKSKLRCPKCNAKVEWQSKDLSVLGFPIENLLLNIKLKSYMNGEMHTFCDECKSSWDVKIKKGEEGKPKLWIEN